MAIGPGRGFILSKIWRVFALATAIWLVAALPCSAVEADAAAVAVETESETTGEVEKYKQEISELKDEIETLKKD